MAFRSLNYWKSIVSRLRGNSPFATSTSQTKEAYAPAGDSGVYEYIKLPWAVRGDFVPVYVAVGLIMMSMSFGLHIGMLQLRYAPGVFVKKSRRETLPEVVEPETVVDEALKFITKSFFRRVAHVQELHRQYVMTDPTRGDLFAR
ncbi:unnamed protein product [Ilex paraguariensis]|uniref:Uncharacterized protein n=1 Tax=Ilex paraguariensis TaxID=185542 RepID=A0ABC8V0M0_9AQUA